MVSSRKGFDGEAETSISCVGFCGFTVLYGGVVMIIVAFALPTWREYEVNGTLAANVSVNLTDHQQYLLYSRTRGFHKTCFKATAVPPNVKITTSYNSPGSRRRPGISYKCTGVKWDFSEVETGAEQTQLKMQWCSIILYAVAFLACAAYLPTSCFAMGKPRFAIISLISLIVAVVCTAAAMALFEQSCVIKENELWPRGVSAFTTAFPGDAYIVACGGVLLLCVSAIIMANLACKTSTADDNKESKKPALDPKRLSVDSLPHRPGAPPYHVVIYNVHSHHNEDVPRRKLTPSDLEKL